MARDESNREDLLREATALVERIELALRDGSSHVVAGFRRDGAFSVFFGEDPVYQFNAAGELRRAYCDGKLFKASGGHLAAMQRVRTECEVQLVRHDLSQIEETEFLQRMTDLIRKLAAAIAHGECDVVGQVSSDGDVLSRVRDWFASHDEWRVAARPNA